SLAPRPPAPPPFPYTTLFRSTAGAAAAPCPAHRARARDAAAHRLAGVARVGHPADGSAVHRPRARLLGARFDPAGRGSVPHRERSEEHTSELQSLRHLVCRLL